MFIYISLLLDLESSASRQLDVVTSSFLRKFGLQGDDDPVVLDLDVLENEVDTGLPSVPTRHRTEALNLPRSERSHLSFSWGDPRIVRLGAGLGTDVLSIAPCVTGNFGSGADELCGHLLDYLAAVVRSTVPHRLHVSTSLGRLEGESAAALGYVGFYSVPPGCIPGYPFLVLLTERELSRLGEGGLSRLKEQAARFEVLRSASSELVIIAALSLDWTTVGEAELRSWRDALGDLVPPKLPKPLLGSRFTFESVSHAVLPEHWPA